MTRRWIGRALLALAPVLAACSSSNPASPSVPTPSPTPVPMVAWRVQLENEEQASFGLRVSLDGERVYDHSGQPDVFHVVEVQRAYVAGTHTIECEVVGVRRSPSLYVARVAVGGDVAGAFYDGAPTSLEAGDVLTLRVPL